MPYGAVGAGTVYGDRTGLVKMSARRRTASSSARTSSAPSDGADSGARQRPALEGGSRRSRDRSRPPDALGGRDGSRARRRRLADPRVAVRRRCRPSSSISGARRPIAAERALMCAAGAVPVGADPATPAAPAEPTTPTAADRNACGAHRSTARRRSGCSRSSGRRVPATATFAMLAATYAKQIGKGVRSRSPHSARRSPAVTRLAPRHVLIAGAACEIHPRRSCRTRADAGDARPLEQATARALAIGVRRRPPCGSANGCWSAKPRAGTDAGAAGRDPAMSPLLQDLFGQQAIPNLPGRKACRRL